MAGKKATGTAVATQKGGALASWEEELAKQAQAQAQVEATVGGSKFFSMKNGVLKYNDNPMKDNEIHAIIVASIFDNAYYEGRFDPNNPSSPVCFAYSRDNVNMVPHEKSKKPQAPACEGCKWNEFGSATEGKGKACKNSRRLALIAATSDTIENPAAIQAAEIALMKLPVTSTLAFSAYAKSLSGGMKIPTFAAVTKIKVVPDPKNQFVVTFEFVEKVPAKVGPAILSRIEQALADLEQPYAEVEETTAPSRTNAKGGKPAGKKKY